MRLNEDSNILIKQIKIVSLTPNKPGALKKVELDRQ